MSDAAKTDKPAGKSKKTMMMGVSALVVVLAGGGYWFMGRASAAPKEKAKAHAADNAEEADDTEVDETGEKGLLPLEPFVVNLVDEGGTHFLRTNIQLIMAAKESDVEGLKEKKVETMPIRSAILELLSQQKASVLVTPEGKEELKAAIKKRVAKVFRKYKIREVLFSEFVVQF